MENYLSEIVSEFKVISSVESIAIGGSSAYMASDNRSDIDVYIFVNENIPVSKREEIIKKQKLKNYLEMNIVILYYIWQQEI